MTPRLFFETAGGEDLGEMLVSRGLARSHGDAAAPPGEKVGELRSKYKRLQEKARRERLGAWGDGAARPTMELSGGSEDKPQTNEGPDLGLPSLSDVLSSEE